MRRIVPFLLLSLAACGGPDFVAPGDGDDQVLTVPIHGTVFDSVTGIPLVGTAVAIQGQFVTTDAEGAYAVTVATGANRISVSVAGFEPLSRTVTVGPERSFDLPLRRLAPFPTQCQLSDQGFSAVVVDLQGRKSLERWSQSTLTLRAANGDRVIDALSWDYTPLDTYRWRVSIPDADSTTFRADWLLYDNTGDLFHGSCEPLPAPRDTTP